MVKSFLRAFAAGLIGYLIGSLPMGLLVGRLYGVDPRRIGSGRTGGTNVYRAAGPFAGVLTALLDALKGAFAIRLVARFLSPAPLPAALTGLGAVMGHNWSLYLGFKGGAGTMTSMGGVLVLAPPVASIIAFFGPLVLYASRMASVASLAASWGAAVLLALFALLDRIRDELVIYGVGQALIITWALRPNISRILNGTERRIGEPRGDQG